MGVWVCRGVGRVMKKGSPRSLVSVLRGLEVPCVTEVFGRYHNSLFYLGLLGFFQTSMKNEGAFGIFLSKNQNVGLYSFCGMMLLLDRRTDVCLYLGF